MYAQYWGLAETPFKNTLDARWFFDSPWHEEALARLLFLIEQRRRCGVLSGPAGTGKSLVLEVLRREAARGAGQAALVDLFGQSGREMLWETLAALGLSPAADDSPQRLWRKLNDRVSANRYVRSPLVLVLDHLDRAHTDCLATVERLQHMASAGDTGLTLILGVRSERASGLAQSLREISDLRIELPAFDREQSQQYVEALLARAGADRPLFEPAAFTRLFDETRGVPRELNRLCDLALLAGMADRAQCVDESIIAAAAEELRVSHDRDQPLLHFRERFAVEM